MQAANFVRTASSVQISAGVNEYSTVKTLLITVTIEPTYYDRGYSISVFPSVILSVRLLADMLNLESFLQRHGCLSDREANSIELLLHGENVAAIAGDVGIATNTERTLLAYARSKLGIPNLAGLVAWGHMHRACCVSLPRYANSQKTITELDGLIRELDEIFEQYGNPAGLTDRDGRFVLWNSTFQQIVGVSDVEIAARRFGDFSAPERRPAVRLQAMEQFDGKRLTLERTFTIRRSDGRETSIRLHTTALSAGGRVNALLGVGVDPAGAPEGSPPFGDGSGVWDDLQTGHANLTGRKVEVVELLAAGLSIGTAAEWRDRSIETIRMHVRHAREKTRTKTLAALLAWWFRHAACCRVGEASDTVPTTPASLIRKLATVFDRPDGAAALLDLDWRPMLWGTRFQSELGVMSSELSSTEFNRLSAFDGQEDVQAAMQDLRRLLLRDARVRVNLTRRDGLSKQLEIDLGIVGKGGEPRAYLVMVQASR